MKAKKERKRKASVKNNAEESQDESQEDSLLVSSSQCVINEEGNVVPNFGKKQKLSTDVKESVMAPEAINERETTLLQTTEIQQSEIYQQEDNGFIKDEIPVNEMVDLGVTEVVNEMVDLGVTEVVNEMVDFGVTKVVSTKEIGGLDMEVKDTLTTSTESEENIGRNALYEISEDKNTVNRMSEANKEQDVLSEISEDESTGNRILESTNKASALSEISEDKRTDNIMSQGCIKQKVLSETSEDKAIVNNISEQFNSNVAKMSDIPPELAKLENSPYQDKCLDMNSSSQIVQTNNNSNIEVECSDGKSDINPEDGKSDINPEDGKSDINPEDGKCSVVVVEDLDVVKTIEISDAPIDIEKHENKSCGPGKILEDRTGHENKSCGPGKILEDRTGHENKSCGSGKILKDRTGHENKSCGPGKILEDRTEHEIGSDEKDERNLNLELGTKNILENNKVPLNEDIERKEEKDINVFSKDDALKESKVLLGEEEHINFGIDEREDRKKKVKSEADYKHKITTNLMLDDFTAKNLVANDEIDLMMKCNVEDITVDEIGAECVISPDSNSQQRVDNEVSHFEQTQVFLSLKADRLHQQDTVQLFNVKVDGDNEKSIKNEHTSHLLDLTNKETDDITDSQLCSINWMDGFTVPEKYQRKMVTKSQDGTTIITGLIKELSQLNTMILRTKRELETARQQLNQGQPLAHRSGQQQSTFQHSGWNNQHNRMVQSRTFNRH